MIPNIDAHSEISRKPINALIDIANNQTSDDGILKHGHNQIVPPRTKANNDITDCFLQIKPYVKNQRQLVKILLGDDTPRTNIKPHVDYIKAVYFENSELKADEIWPGCSMDPEQYEGGTIARIDQHGYVYTKIPYKENPAAEETESINAYFLQADDGYEMWISNIKDYIIEENTGYKIEHEINLMDFMYQGVDRPQLSKPYQCHLGVIDFSNEADFEMPPIEWYAEFSHVQVSSETSSYTKPVWEMYLGKPATTSSEYRIFPSFTVGGIPIHIDSENVEYFEDENGETYIRIEAANDAEPELYGEITWEGIHYGEATFNGRKVPKLSFSSYLPQGADRDDCFYPNYPYIFFAKKYGDIIYHGTCGKITLAHRLVDTNLSAGAERTTYNSIEFRNDNALQIFDFDGNRNDVSSALQIDLDDKLRWLTNGEIVNDQIPPKELFMIQTLDDNGNRKVDYRALKLSIDISSALSGAGFDPGRIDEMIAVAGGLSVNIQELSADLSNRWRTDEGTWNWPADRDDERATCRGRYINAIYPSKKSVIDLLSCQLLSPTGLSDMIWSTEGGFIVSGGLSACGNNFTITPWRYGQNLLQFNPGHSGMTGTSCSMTVNPDEMRLENLGMTLDGHAGDSESGFPWFVIQDEISTEVSGQIHTDIHSTYISPYEIWWNGYNEENRMTTAKAIRLNRFVQNSAEYEVPHNLHVLSNLVVDNKISALDGHMSMYKELGSGGKYVFNFKTQDQDDYQPNVWRGMTITHNTFQAQGMGFNSVTWDPTGQEAFFSAEQRGGVTGNETLSAVALAVDGLWLDKDYSEEFHIDQRRAKMLYDLTQNNRWTKLINFLDSLSS